MKKQIVVLLALALGGCTASQSAAIVAANQRYQAALQNFKNAEDAINGSIAMTSQTLGPYCAAAKSAGDNLVKITSGNSTATTALNTTATALTTYCNAMPTDIQSAIVTLTAAAAAAKQAAEGS